jgi:3-hydroxyisobutyrate dehydrogenase
MVNRNYAVNFLLKLMAKDMCYAQTEAESCDVNLTTAEVSRALFERAIASGYGDQDMASVIEPLRTNK